MTHSDNSAASPRLRHASRYWIIGTGVLVAVAVPVLPLGFISQQELISDMGEMVEHGRNWINQISPRSKPAGSVKDDQPGTRSPAPGAVENLQLLEQAAHELSGQLAKQPDDPSLHNRLGLVYMSLGEPNEAIASFHRAVTHAREGIAAASARVKAFQQEGKTAEASSALIEASRYNVELSAAHSNLARVFESRGEHTKVVAQLEALNREAVLFDGGQQSRCTMAEQKMSGDTANLLAVAESLMGERRFAEARQAYARVLDRDPNVALAHHQLGVLMAMSNNHVQAKDALETAARLDPNSAQTHNNLGLTYQALGLPGQAAAAFARATSLDPQSVEAAINLGNLHYSQGKASEAVRAYRHALSYEPGNARAHNNLATVLSLEGNYQEAIVEFQKALAADPQMASAHYGLGLVLYNMKNYLPAIKEFKTALALNPDLQDCRAKIEESYRRASFSSGR